MLKACAQLVQKLSVRRLVRGARVYTFVVRLDRSTPQVVGKARVILLSASSLSTAFYTALFSKLHLLAHSYTHNPHPLLLLTKKI
jgi:hypothetical protein